MQCLQSKHDFDDMYLCISNWHVFFNSIISKKKSCFFHLKKDIIISDVDIVVSLLPFLLHVCII